MICTVLYDGIKGWGTTRQGATHCIAIMEATQEGDRGIEQD